MLDTGFYRLAEKLLDQCLKGNGTIQSLALQEGVRHKKRMVALLSETLKAKAILD